MEFIRNDLLTENYCILIYPRTVKKNFKFIIISKYNKSFNDNGPISYTTWKQQ